MKVYYSSDVNKAVTGNFDTDRPKSFNSFLMPFNADEKSNIHAAVQAMINIQNGHIVYEFEASFGEIITLSTDWSKV